VKSLNLLILLFLLSSPSYAEEICIDQQDYEKALEGVKLILAPQYQFEGHLSSVEILLSVRMRLDASGNRDVIEHIDFITNSKLSMLNSSLVFMDPNEFDAKYRQRVLEIAQRIKESREEIPSSYSYDSLNVLLAKLGYNNPLNGDADGGAR